MSTKMVRATALAVCMAVVACGGDGKGLAEAAKGRPETVEELVRELYGAIARDDAATACSLFTQVGEYALLDDTGMSTCAEVIHEMAIEVGDPDAFATLTLELHEPGASEYDEWCSGGPGTVQVVIPEGDEYPPGAFAYAEQPEGGWAVVGYNSSDCPA